MSSGYLLNWFAAQDPVFSTTDSVNGLDFELSVESFSTSNSVDHRSIIVNRKNTNKPFEVKTLRFNSRAKLSHPVLLSSDLGLSERLVISSYEVEKEEDGLETRVVNFSESYSSVLKSLRRESKWWSKPQMVVNLPNEYLTFALKEEGAAAKRFSIPNFAKGLSAVEDLASGRRSLRSIAWGLLLSVAYAQKVGGAAALLCYSQVVEVIALVKGTGQLFVDTFSQSTFRRGDWSGEYRFSSLSTEELQIREGLDYYGLSNSDLVVPDFDQDRDTDVNVLDNAFLGFALTKTLHYLTKLKWFSTEFKATYKNGIKAAVVLAYSCVGAVSRDSGWCAEVVEDGYYQYESLSASATLVSSLFFNALLSLEYNSLIHEKAARMLVAIDPVVRKRIADVKFFMDEEEQICGWRALWLAEFDPEYLEDAIIEYVEVRLKESVGRSRSVIYLEEEEALRAEREEDWLVGALSTAIKKGLLPRSKSTTLGLDQDYRIPEFFEPNISMVRDHLGFEGWTELHLSELAPYAIVEWGDRLVTGKVFETFALTADAVCTFAWYELARMMPAGQYWVGEEKELDRSTVIGSVLYSYARSYFVFALRLAMLKLPLLQSSGFILQKLVESFLPIAQDLSEFDKRFLLNTVVNESLSIEEKLSLIFSLTISENVQSDIFDLSIIENEDSTITTRLSTLSSERYSSFIFQEKNITERSKGKKVFLTRTKKELSERPVPGILCQELDSAECVESGDILVSPLNLLTAKQEYETHSSIPSHLTSILDLAAPVGISIVLRGTTSYEQPEELF